MGLWRGWGDGEMVRGGGIMMGLLHGEGASRLGGRRGCCAWRETGRRRGRRAATGLWHWEAGGPAGLLRGERDGEATRGGGPRRGCGAGMRAELLRGEGDAGGEAVRVGGRGCDAGRLREEAGAGRPGPRWVSGCGAGREEGLLLGEGGGEAAR
jgi:hypothetical protein